jgi:hypothetical protein
MKYLFLLLFFAVSCFECGNRRENPEKDYIRLVAEKIDDLTQKNNHTALVAQQVFWGNDTSKYRTLDEFTGQTLFFFFSDNTCSPCIDHTVELIGEVFPDYLENDRVVFMSPDYPARFRENCHGKKLLGVKNGKLGLPLEGENVPFLFTLNGDLQVCDLHIVNKNDFDKTSEYLKNIAKKLSH